MTTDGTNWRGSKCRVRDRTGRCDKSVAVKMHGLCIGHYSRLCRTGSVGPVTLRPRRSLKPFTGR